MILEAREGAVLVLYSLSCLGAGWLIIWIGSKWAEESGDL